MGIVIAAGEVRPGDPIEVELPPEPRGTSRAGVTKSPSLPGNYGHEIWRITRGSEE